MDFIKFAIDRPVTTWVMIVVLVILGAMAFTSIPINFTPDISVPIVTVQVIYPGAGAEEIETNITQKIEDEVSTISGIDDVESYIMEGFTQVIIRFDLDKDPDVANQEVKDKIDKIINDFPEDAEDPVIGKYDIMGDAVVQLSFVSDMKPIDANQYVEDNLKNKLSIIAGVAQVEINGGQNREIKVVLNTQKLKKYSISPLQIVSFLQQNNLSVPGGSIKKSGKEYTVKFDGEIESLEELRTMKIVTPKGERRLEEISAIIDGAEDRTDIGRFHNLLNGKDKGNTNVINLDIQKLKEANSVSVAEAVIAEVKKINETLPEGSSLEIARDSSTFVKDSVNDTMSAIYLGILFTALVLYIFLHNVRSTIVVAFSMPIVLIATFLAVKAAGFTLNVMSLMAMSVSVGTLVTNSVVILENIDRYVNMGMGKLEASYKGTKEIAVAVLASTLTNIVVFVPIGTMDGIAGMMFKEFGLTVVFIMGISILVSFTVTPMLASQIIRDKHDIERINKKRKRKIKQMNAFGIWFENKFEKISIRYMNTVGWIIKSWQRRLSIIALSILFLVGVIASLGKKIDREFFPVTDNGEAKVSIEFPPYYDIEKTSEMFEMIENRIKVNKDVEKIIVNIGKLGSSQGVYLGSMNVLMKDDRITPTEQLVDKLSNDLSDIPDAIIKVSKASQFNTGKSAISFDVLGADIEVVKDLTYQVYDIAVQVEGAVNVDTDIRPGKPEIKVIPDRRKISDLNLNAYTIGMTIRANVEGISASKYRVNGEEYDITVSLAEEDIEDINRLKDLVILTSKGPKKLSELAKLEYTTAPTMLYKKSKLLKHSVTADVGNRSLGKIVSDIQAGVDEKIDIPDGYEIQQGGDSEHQNDSQESMKSAFMLAIVLTFLLIVAILESWSQGIFIMFTVPLAMIGVVLGLVVFGVGLNVLSMMAIIMLIGIVVNNAILMLDYANQLHRTGTSVSKAILEASHLKLKPIIMATLAAVLGMMPLALGLGSGAEMRQGVGVVSMSGLLMSAILTLYVIPAFYVQFSRKNKDNTEG